ncbi:MAG TPA: ABC transporter permease [Acidobacteriaceae bacterium]|nr:ABC transporter permease [Acidobacteriaceae bacterium]
MEAILQDIRYAWRQLRHAPGFTLTAVLTLALAIGANTAIFSLLDQALLRLLPVHDPRQLVVLQGTGKVWNGRISINGGSQEAYFSYPMYLALRDKNQVFDGLIGMDQAQVGLAYDNRSNLANAELVTGNYFNVLGVPPALGRVFTQQDDVDKNGSPVSVLSFNYWRSHFGANPRILNQTVSINGHPFQVVGVAAPGFQSAIWGSPADIFVPMTMKPQVIPGVDDLQERRSKWMNIIGRLKPGESAKRAEVSLAPLWHAERADELKAMETRKPHFVDEFLNKSRLLVLDGGEGFSYQRDDLRTPLLAVMGMVVLVILMASVNVASLVLVRAAARTREFSMRYALGAKRGRMIQQLIIEGLMVGLSGGAAALLVAPAATRLLLSRMPLTNGEPTFSSQLDTRILLFNFAVAAGVSLLFSLAPVMQFWKPDLVGPMKNQSSGSTGGRLNFRRATVGLQIGLSLLLLVCSGLFVRTLHNLRAVDVGFATDHVVQFAVDPALAGYAPGQVAPLHKRILSQLSSLPGVRAVAATDNPELTGNNSINSISIAGYTPQEDENISPETSDVTPGYFAAMQMPLIAGRAFTEQDDATHPKVAIVNQSFATKYFGNAQNAIGKLVSASKTKDEKFDTQIIGVSRNAIHQSVNAEIKPALFRSYLQQEQPLGGMMYYVRTYAAPEETMNTIRLSMQQLDSKLVLDSLRTLDAQIDDNISTQRIVALLAVGFGLLATLLAAIGLYGVLAYSTAQRTREIGIRMALGADRLGVVRLMLLDVLKLAGLSILITIPVALILTRTLRSQLYHVSTFDPLILAIVTVIVALVVLLAAALPARRAASINPSNALRAE